MRPRSTSARRVFAWACLLALLVALAVPAASVPHAILTAGPVLDAPRVVTLLCAIPHTTPPDLFVAASLPARAPPLA